MSKLYWQKSFMFAVLAIPTHEAGLWQVEKFSHAPANEVSYSPKGIRVQVNKSAGPMIYPLVEATMVREFFIRGEFLGLPKLKEIAKEGEKGNDDFPLRIGLIVPGEKRLTGLKRLFAPGWVKRLYSQVPSGKGIDHVHFFNFSQNPSHIGSGRVHPASELIKEDFVSLVSASGPFSLRYTIKEPMQAVALWLSIDGDDTKSEFDVLISELELNSGSEGARDKK